MTRFARRADDAGIIETRTAESDGASGPSGSRSARLVGAVGLVALTFLLFWLLTDDGFRVTPADVSVTGVRLADPAAVRDHISGIERAPNIFRLRVIDIVEDLGALPEVAFARASVALPAVVTIEVVERQPIFIWSNGGEAWLVDGTGVLFSPRDESDIAAAVAAAGLRVAEEASSSPTPAALISPSLGLAGEVDADATTGPSEDASIDPNAGVADGVLGSDIQALAVEVDADAAIAALPILEDARIVEVPFVAGDRLPAIDFAVMRQLLAITPGFIGSDSASISLRIDDGDGYVLESEEIGWQAVFGHYRANVQPPDVVPLQAQCLASLLATRPERRIDRVVLAPTQERCGTFRTVKNGDPEA